MKVIKGTKCNNLIYYTSCGDAYIKEVELSIKSLRANGYYTGDIKLFTSPSQHVPDHLSNICEVVRVDLKDWLTSRFDISKLYDFNNYDKVLFLDSDVLCVRPIRLMWECHASSTFSIVTEKYKMRKWVKQLQSYFTEEEITSMRKDPIINAGTFICDGKCYKEFMSSWHDYYNSHFDNYKPNDQTALHRMYYDNHLNFRNLPRGIVTMPKQEDEKGHTVLLHYCGMKKNRQKEMEERFLSSIS
jgi:hypothetical protein